MIGFDESFRKFAKLRENEGPETNKLSKKQLYEDTSEIWYVPPQDSKGMTRSYLIKVRHGQVFRVALSELKNFEVALTKPQQKKVGIVNNALLVRKLNMLLRSRQMPELGFDEFDLPDERWLYRVARYIDTSNLMEFFEAPVNAEPPVSHQSSDITKIYYGRVFASQKFYFSEELMQNKKFFRAVQALSEKHRNLISMRVLADVLEHELVAAKAKVVTNERELHDMVGKLAFTYTAFQDPAITPDLVIAQSQNLKPEHQKLLNYNRQL